MNDLYEFMGTHRPVLAVEREREWLEEWIARVGPYEEVLSLPEIFRLLDEFSKGTINKIG